MKKSSSIIWGLILVAAGVIFALNAFNIADIDLFFDGWWTLFIIVPCTVGLFTEREKTGNLIGILIGVFLLLCCQDILSFDMLWKAAFPAIVIIVGVKMIFSGIAGNRGSEIAKEIASSGGTLKNSSAVFSGQKINFDGEVFEGIEIDAVFGGVDCDLRNAVFTKDCVVKASAIFGGINIYVPDNINVKVNSTSIFGGISDKKHRNSKENGITLYINGTCMFGGIDIK